jgi:hypothetical protein
VAVHLIVPNFKRFTSQSVLRQGTGETRMEQCEGSFVADAPVERRIRPTSSAQVGPSAGVSCDLPRN